MSQSRRNIDRRRRVLYTSNLAEPETTIAARRRNALLLREARKPTAAYGARVQRRIRGRWFSLVPIRRRNLMMVAATLWGVALLLSLAHYASVSWPSLTANPQLARPLRLDQSDSFGRWVTTLLWAGSAGASLLIYQLRRYRIDDFQGHYRLWRLVIILCGLASLDSLVSMIDWSGAVLDAVVGRRVALSGNGWVRVVVTVGGAVLALRLTAEVRRSRWSLVTMILGWTLLAIPVAAHWNFFQISSLAVWTLVTTAPLLATTTLFLAFGGYLRLLYREVRQVEEADSLALRFQQLRARLFRREEADEESDQVEQDERSPAEVVRKRWWHRKPTDPDAEPVKPSREERRDAARIEREALAAQRAEAAAAVAVKAAATDSLPAASKAAAAEKSAVAPPDSASPRKRRWFGLRAAKPTDGEGDASGAERAAKTAANPKSLPSQPRRRFSLRLSPAAAATDAAPHAAAKTAAPTATDRTLKASQADDSEEASPVKGRGFGLGWFRKSAPETAVSGESASRTPKASARVDSGDADDSDDGEDFDDADVDYSGMNKAERRRLRKQLRRGGKAA